MTDNEPTPPRASAGELVSTDLPEEMRDVAKVYRRDLHRCRDDVTRLKKIAWRAPVLFSLGVAFLGPVGAGATGLLNYYGTTPRPGHVEEIVYWCLLLGGALLAVTLSACAFLFRVSYHGEIDRIVAEVESLDY